MLNTEKVRMMTALAIYEKNGGAQELKTAEHYGYDYVMTQLFSAFIRYTLCFGVGLALYLVFRANEFFYSINAEGFIVTVRSFGIYYFAGLLLYLLTAFLISFRRHRRAVKNTELYAASLRRLDRRFGRRRPNNT